MSTLDGSEVNCSTWGSVSQGWLIHLLIGLGREEFISGSFWVGLEGLELHSMFQHIIATMQEKELLVHAIHRVNLSPTME